MLRFKINIIDRRRCQYKRDSTRKVHQGIPPGSGQTGNGSEDGAAHKRTRQTYGPERLQHELTEHGVRVDICRIRRIRKKLGLRCKQKRKFKVTIEFLFIALELRMAGNIEEELPPDISEYYQLNFTLVLLPISQARSISPAYPSEPFLKCVLNADRTTLTPCLMACKSRAD